MEKNGKKYMYFQKQQNHHSVSKFLREKRIWVGLRTMKTAAAVILSMGLIIVSGSDTSKIIFAMLGAMAAMEHTFKESVEACLTQFVGMFFGAIAGILLRALPIYPLFSAGIGIVLVIILYNGMHIRFSPSLPCLIVVIMCMTPDIQPLDYALGRLWASGIGLGVGLFINIFIFPYDNSKQICRMFQSMKQQTKIEISLIFGEEDGTSQLHKMQELQKVLKDQVKIFSEQTILLSEEKKRKQMESLEACLTLTGQMLSQLEVLLSLETPGEISESNWELLLHYGFSLPERKKLGKQEEKGNVSLEKQDEEQQKRLDVITNYTLEQILNLYQQLKDLLENEYLETE